MASCGRFSSCLRAVKTRDRRHSGLVAKIVVSVLLRLSRNLLFLGLTPDDDPSPGMRLLAIATELVNQIKFYCNDSTIQPPTFWAKNMPLSREN